MNQRKNATYQMLTQVANFASQGVGFFPKTSAASEILDALESGIQTLSEQARIIASSDAEIRRGLGDKKAARERLKLVMTSASQIADALGAGTWRIPDNRSDRALIHAGRAFSVDVEPMRKDFAKHGISPETMSASVDALEQALLACSDARAKRSTAAQKWDTVLGEMLNMLKRYDALVALTLGDNPNAMASYALARTIPQTRARKIAAAETPAAAAPAAGAPATAA
jgi:hypothetical protein